MGKWKTYLTWTIAAIGGLYLLYFGLLAGMRKHETGEYGKIRALAHPDSIYDLIILGSSRAETGVIPTTLTDTPSDAFNFGFVGASVPFQEVLLQTILAKDQKPSTVILCLDLHNLVNQAPTMNPNQFLAACSNSTFRKGFFKLAPDFRWRYHIAPYGLIRLHDGEVYAGIRGLLGRETQFDRAHQRGYVPVPTQRNTNWLKETDNTIRVNMHEEIFASLERIHQICLDEKINLILIAPPLHPDYLPLLSGLDKARSYILNWTKIRELPYLDLTDALSNPVRFMDHSHLDPVGAEQMTEQIRKLTTDLSIGQ